MYNGPGAYYQNYQNPGNHYQNQNLTGFKVKKEEKKKGFKFKVWFLSRKYLFFAGKFFSFFAKYFSKFFKSIIKKLYFRYCYKDSDLIEEFVVHFVPEDVSGSNPHFFVHKMKTQASKHSWEALVEILQSGPKISYIRKSYE